MELQTIGQHNAPGYPVLLWHNPVEEFAPELGFGSRFRLIWVEGGTGILRVGQRQITFGAPALFCLNELERPHLEYRRQLKAQALYFHPNVVNGDFTFENIRGPFDSTDAQDRDWLFAFIRRGANENIHISLGPTVNGQVSRLVAAISQELNQQPDGYWPCRSRSYFLELLFLVDRLCLEQSISPEIKPLPGTETTKMVDELALYLHSHYAEKITLQHLSREFHSNRTTLTQQFHESTGTSIMTYLAQIRIRVASLMLCDTTLPIAEVMSRVGYNDTTHFGRTFRKYTNLTPSEYRKKYNRELQ